MKRKQIFSLIVCGLAVLALVFSVSFIAIRSNHDCIGDGCSVCEQLDACVQNLRSVGTAVIVFAIIFALAIIAVAFFGKPCDGFILSTPVLLKVKLTN